MRITVFFLVSFLGFAQYLHAQQWIENGTLDTISVNLKQKKSNDFHQNEVNRILGSIAYTHQKPADILRVNWELISSYQVFRQKQGHFKTDIFIKALAPLGDLNLYEFNSSMHILPELQSFRLRIFKEDSSLIYLKRFNENPISVNSVGQIAHFSINHQRWAKGWYMEIDQFDFLYNDQDYTFEQWFQYTNDYKAANFLVGELLRNYQQLQQSPQEPCPFLVKSLRQADYLKNLYQLPFYRATVLRKNDPDNLDQKMKVLSTLLDLNIEKYAVLFKKSNSGEYFSIDYLVNAYLEEEKNLLVLQQKYASIYDDLFRQLIKINYPTNLSYKNLDFFEIIADESAAGKMQVFSFENRLFAKSIVNIDNLIQNNQFTEALYTIDNLERFVLHAESLQLNNDLSLYKARAAYGMYYSYANVVDKAIKIKNTKLAIQYIKKASTVQDDYSKEIINNNLVKKKIRHLLDVCYLDYFQMIEQNNYSEAAAKRDTIRNIIVDFQLVDVQLMLDQISMFENNLPEK